MRTLKKAVLVFLTGLLLTVGVALASNGASVEWSVVGGGGGRAEAGSYAVEGTVGQPVVGSATTNSSEVCSGFWCGATVEYNLYLPLVSKKM